MRYYAKDLPAIYEILEAYPRPLAVLDFLCGEVGCEIRVAQSWGGQFYDKHHNAAHVVALCWQGASLLYSNLSDDQIEFADKKRSRSGDRRHDGGRKIHWLDKMGHEGRLAGMKNIIAHQAPQDVSEKAMVGAHGLSAVEQWMRTEERLTCTGFIFSAGGKRLIQDPYIALFDRNEKHQPGRNTRRWQIDLFHKWAREFGFQLVVISDFYPRPQPDNVISLAFNRDLDLLCNVMRHSILYVAPASGAGDAGMVFGCDFVLLNPGPKKMQNVLPQLAVGRGFQHFGTLTEHDGEVANRARKYLAGCMGARG